MAATYDQLVEQEVGAFGLWQITALSALIFCANAPLLQFQQLAHTTPPHFCAQPLLEARGWSRDQIRNATVPQLANKIEYDSCRQFNLSAKDLNSSFGESLPDFGDRSVVSCLHGWSYEEGPTVFSRSVPRDFDLVCDRRVLASWCGSAFILGMVFGPFISGFFSDRYGRRLVCVVCSILTGLVAIATSVLSTSWLVYWIFRFLVGLFSSASNITSYVWGAECTSLNRQNTFNIAYHLIANNVVEAFYIGLSAIFRDWRWVHATVAVPQFLIVALLFFIPESPRWLLSVGRSQEAAQALGRIAAGNRRHNANFAGLLKAEEVKMNAVPYDAKKEARATWMLLFTNRNYRTKLFGFLYLWIGVNILYYGFVYFSVQLKGNPFVIAAIGSLIGLPFIIAKFIILKIFKPRTVLVGSHLGILLLGVALGLSLWLMPAHVINVVLGTGGTGISFFLFMCLYTVVPGLFPTDAQNFAMGLLVGLSRVGSGIAPFIAKMDSFTGWKWFPAAIITATVALGLIVVIFVPLSKSEEEVEIFTCDDHEELTLQEGKKKEEEEEGKFLPTRV